MATQWIVYPGALSGSGGGGGSAVYTDESPVGVVDGVNVTYTLSTAPFDLATLNLFLDGVRQNRPLDYTIAGAVITMAVAPALGQSLWANYRSS